MFITITVEVHKEQFDYGDPMGRTELTLNIDDCCNDFDELGSCTHIMLQAAIARYRVARLNMDIDAAKEEPA
jgi:hypothetical protein